LKVEIEDVLFWMDAIRNSKDRYRTLESFWKGQVRSKIWLIENLQRLIKADNVNIDIVGGWNGVLASLLFNSDISICHINSIDIDPTCETTAFTINKRQEMEGRFTAITSDMVEYKSDADIIINTSCEHITQDQYNKWLSTISNDTLIVLQSNNYDVLDEHIRCVNNLKEFIDQSKLDIIDSAELPLDMYSRYMIVGYKSV